MVKSSANAQCVKHARVIERPSANFIMVSSHLRLHLNTGYMAAIDYVSFNLKMLLQKEGVHICNNIAPPLSPLTILVQCYCTLRRLRKSKDFKLTDCWSDSQNGKGCGADQNHHPTPAIAAQNKVDSPPTLISVTDGRL